MLIVMVAIAVYMVRRKRPGYRYRKRLPFKHFTLPKETKPVISFKTTAGPGGLKKITRYISLLRFISPRLRPDPPYLILITCIFLTARFNRRKNPNKTGHRAEALISRAVRKVESRAELLSMIAGNRAHFRPKVENPAHSTTGNSVARA